MIAPAPGANSAMVLTMAATSSRRASSSRATRPLMRKVVAARRRRDPRRRDPPDRRLDTPALDLHHDRQDHRPPLGLLEEEPRQGVVDLGLQVAQLGAMRVVLRLAEGGDP